MGINTIDPSTGTLVKEFSSITDREIDEKISRAQRCFDAFRDTTFAQRATLMQRAAEILLQRKHEFAHLITLEMGKTIRDASAEIEKCAWVCRYYAEKTEAFLADEEEITEADKSFVRYQPLGIILAVMPWNYPFWQVFRFIAPALMAGNVGLLKHASNVPQSALAIEEIMTEAGFPAGAFQTLLIPASKVALVTGDPRVKAATLTGSEPAGASLASSCGKVLKKTVLELGGSDPFIVLPSAKIDDAVATATKARIVNNGQACIAAKRFILHESIADDFTEKLVAKYASLKVGDPFDQATDIGPLVSASALEEIEEQVQKCREQGGTVLFGGDRSALPVYENAELKNGNYFPPTIVEGLSPDSPIAQEEIFGPVALIFRVPDLKTAIQVANGTDFGLGASAWTTDATEAEQLINALEAGCVFINSMVKSDPRLPFGGIKRSGYGRELSIHGIREFVNIKTVWVQ